MHLAGEDLDSLRLGYAQHVYRQQGATVERTVVVTGGWQTSKESAYVEASRARHGTDWFLAREELGSQGQDADRVCSSRAGCAPAERSSPRSPTSPTTLRSAPATTSGLCESSASRPS